MEGFTINLDDDSQCQEAVQNILENNLDYKATLAAYADKQNLDDLSAEEKEALLVQLFTFSIGLLRNTHKAASNAQPKPAGEEEEKLKERIAELEQALAGKQTADEAIDRERAQNAELKTALEEAKAAARTFEEKIASLAEASADKDKQVDTLQLALDGKEAELSKLRGMAQQLRLAEEQLKTARSEAMIICLLYTSPSPRDS